jgi:hypothetical protein
LLTVRNGMPHNIGRKFYKCKNKGKPGQRGCEFWMWEDGSLPFSEQSQRRFNDWMDSSGFGCDISCFEDRVILGPWILDPMIHYEDLYNTLSDEYDNEDEERDEDESQYDEEDDGSDADADEDEEINEENPN